MKFIRLFTGADNKSHFKDEKIPQNDSPYGKITESIQANTVVFGEIDEPKEISWHNPPRPQYVIMLHGAMEIEVGNGDKRIFREGDILLAEDVTGQGHVTRAASEGIRKYMVISLK